MLKVAMLALGATLTFGAIAPQDAAAQLNGRERVNGRTTTTTTTSDRRNSRIDNRCHDDDRDSDRDSDRGGKGHGKNKSGREDRDDSRYDSRYDTRYDTNYNNCDNGVYSSTTNGRRGNGPPFCRNGQGHPVHGMQWCRDKGWTNGYSLRNVGWEDVILRRRNVAQGDLGRSVLSDILGRAVYSRFDTQRERLGVNAPLTGRWQETSNGTLLDLFAGGLQIAQILDRNRDGRADVVLLNYGDAR